MFGFIHVGAATPTVAVCNCRENAKRIIECVREANEYGLEMVVFPELCITGYTCGDLFLQGALLNEAQEQLLYITKELSGMDIIAVVGLPFENNGKIYNCAAVLYKGTILGIVPKTHIPNYGEFYEKRYFAEGLGDAKPIFFGGHEVLFGTNILFCSENNKNFVFAVEICEDLWTVIPPSCYHAMAGATVIVNLSAGNETAGKDDYRRSLVSSQSSRIIGGYVYASAGYGESTTDLVFAGHNIVCENGKIIEQSERFENGIIYADIDVDYLAGERRARNTFYGTSENYKRVYFNTCSKNRKPLRVIDRTPFIPKGAGLADKRMEEIITLQALGLRKRIEHIGCKNVVIGISGGLDSTHALLVTARAFEMAGLDKDGIVTVTMPCFGTSERTYNNAVKLCGLLNTNFYEIDIKESVLKHFEDIGLDTDDKGVAYENSQARERTQVLMDMANKIDGFVVGTGDLSELALGFATYNGDHMSMYGVNGSVPKTLIRHLIKHVAESDSSSGELREVLLDILDTPVSPELIEGQVTEDIVGPYELNDFFLYNLIRMRFSPDKILYLAQIAFEDVYSDEVIRKWLEIFYKRFFGSAYKRSCMPDGPKVGSVSLSPRGGFRMPSDADSELWSGF